MSLPLTRSVAGLALLAALAAGCGTAAAAHHAAPKPKPAATAHHHHSRPVHPAVTTHPRSRPPRPPTPPVPSRRATAATKTPTTTAAPPTATGISTLTRPRSPEALFRKRPPSLLSQFLSHSLPSGTVHRCSPRSCLGRSRTAADAGERWPALLESVLGATPQEFESPILRHTDLVEHRRRLGAGAVDATDQPQFQATS
jgi:hypothetical protein